MTCLLVTRYPLVALIRRSWAPFPGIHIAQFPYQVIGNCGLIFLMQCNNLPQGKKTLACLTVASEWVQRLRQWSFSRELRPHLSVGGVRNMTVSWPWRLASISGAAGGEFDDGCVVDRWDWLAIGRSLDGRSWHPDGPEFRQYPDSLGYGRGMHGGDHAQPLGSCSGTEENRIPAWPCG